MSKVEFMKKEIERQREIEGDKTFKKFRVVTYEQKKSGGYPFSDFETDNFFEAVSFGKQKMEEQKQYRPNSEYLWVSISEFQPIHERSNVIHLYKTMIHFGENDVIDSKFENGGALIGNQKRIDMNHNGRIDAEDFKLLKGSMNGSWRNEHKHVNHSENHEVRYARKHTSRTGYKGKRDFEGGGRVRRTKAQMTKDRENKDIDAYNWYVVDIKENKAITGFEYKEDAQDVLSDYDDKKRYKVVSKKTLKTLGIENPNESWKSYSKGGETFAEKSSAIAKKYQGKTVAPKYQRNYGKRYDKDEAKEVGNKIVGKMVSMGMDKKALGGFFGKSSIVSAPKVSAPKVSLDEKQVKLNTGEWVQVLDHSGNTLMVMDLNKLGSGAVPKRVNISEVDMTSFMAGGKVKSKTTTKKSSGSTKRGGAMQLAKEIRKEGEKWTDAVKRASAQLKK